jgi:uncharacterized membrane protein YgcG
MMTTKLIGILLSALFLTNSIKGQNITHGKDENSPIKTIGIIDEENIYTVEQEQYFDSISVEFHKKTSIRIVVITCDSSRRVSLFMKVRQNWGYTDTEIEKDIAIVINSKGQKMMGFYDNWVNALLGVDTISQLVRNHWWPDFKNNLYFDALCKLFNVLLPEIEKKLK